MIKTIHHWQLPRWGDSVYTGLVLLYSHKLKLTWIFSKMYICLQLVSFKRKKYVVDFTVFIAAKRLPQIVSSRVLRKRTDKDAVCFSHSLLQIQNSKWQSSFTWSDSLSSDHTYDVTVIWWWFNCSVTFGTPTSTTHYHHHHHHHHHHHRHIQHKWIRHLNIHYKKQSVIAINSSSSANK